MTNSDEPGAGAAYPNPRARGRGGGIRRAVHVLLVSLLLTPALLALPVVAPALAAPATVPPGTNSTVAWGVAANASFTAAVAGNINSSSIPGANLSASTVAGSLSVAIAEQYANYAVLTVQLPSSTTEFVELQAVVYRAVELQADVSAQLPVAGTYAPGQSVPTSPENGSISLAESGLDADVAFLNLTRGTNGSLALASEHVEVLRAFNVSVQAAGFPNVTTSSNGSVTVKYVSGAFAAAGLAVANLSAAFSPAIVVYAGPVPNGTRWSTSSEGTFHGAVAETVRYAAQVPGGAAARWSSSNAETVALTVPFTVDCLATSVPIPGGANGTEVACSSTGNLTLGADGLAFVPTSALSGPAGSVSAPADGADPASAETAVPARPIYRPGGTAPQSVTASPQNGQNLTAAPMSPAGAQAQMTALRTAAPIETRPSASPAAWLVLLGGVGVLAVVVVLGVSRQRLRE